MINAYRPRIRKRIEEEQKKNPIKMPEAPKTSQGKTADAINQLKESGKSSKSQEIENRNRQRNAGKQHHRQ